VPQRPNGAEARKRCPRRLRPRSRVILVLTAVSSMNTRRARPAPEHEHLHGGRLVIIKVDPLQVLDDLIAVDNVEIKARHGLKSYNPGQGSNPA
jgi:hypothetical protein